MTHPFTAFNFRVEITPDGAKSPLAEAAFAECDGLEATFEIKTIREGGDNARAIRVPGFDLWTWAQNSILNPMLRANAEVVMFAADRTTIRARYLLHRCLPVKFKAPAFNAKDGAVAIEEFQLAYEKFDIIQPPAGGGQ